MKCFIYMEPSEEGLDYKEMPEWYGLIKPESCVKTTYRKLESSRF